MEIRGHAAKRLHLSVAAVIAFSAVGLAMAFATNGSLAAQMQSDAGKSPAAMEPIPALTPYVEAHTHFDDKDPEVNVRAALAALGRQNAAMMFFQIPPDTFDHPGHYDEEVILPAAKKYPDKLRVLAGGGSINSIIIQAVATGDAGPAVQKKLKEKAEQLLSEGVIGFGELTTLHFETGTPYQYAPPDHPLYLELADIAAAHGVPIDIHMEAVVNEGMPLPAGLKSPPNPPTLHANIAAFERLLAHNPKAKIIWAHIGTDGTGDRTVELNARLLKAHPNLYMEIKVNPSGKGLNYPMENGKIKPDWWKLFTDFPDRFIIGTDQHYPEKVIPGQSWQEAVLLFNQLPSDVRKKMGTENVAHIYGPSIASALHVAKN